MIDFVLLVPVDGHERSALAGAVEHSLVTICNLDEMLSGDGIGTFAPDHATDARINAITDGSHARLYALEHYFDVSGIDVPQDEYEFIAAPARNHVVCANCIGERLGGLRKHAVAGCVAEVVVDSLEANQVYRHHRDALDACITRSPLASNARLRDFQLSREPIHNRCPCKELREPIRERDNAKLSDLLSEFEDDRYRVGEGFWRILTNLCEIDSALAHVDLR